MSLKLLGSSEKPHGGEPLEWLVRKDSDKKIDIFHSKLCHLMDGLGPLTYHQLDQKNILHGVTNFTPKLPVQGGGPGELLPLPPVRHVPPQPPGGPPQVRGEGVQVELPRLPGGHPHQQDSLTDTALQPPHP